MCSSDLETVLMETPARTATSLIPAINTPYHEMVIIHDAVSILSYKICSLVLRGFSSISTDFGYNQKN